MSSSPLEVLAVAEKLKVEVNNEAALRSAISRAYYSALLTADQTLPHRQNVRSGGESSHEKIIARADVYGVGANPGRREATNVAKLLPRIKRDRVKADYHLDETVTEKECNDAVARAKQVIAWCDEVADRIERTAASLAADTTKATESVSAPSSLDLDGARPSGGGKPSLTRIR